MKMLLEYDTESEKQDWFTLRQTLAFQTPFGIITVPEGYTTDFASIPKPIWGIMPPVRRDAPADVLHDYLYEHAGRINRQRLSRLQCDVLWLCEMAKHNPRGILRTAIKFNYVRVFGWKNWNKYRRQLG